jgi:hypothetical protein
VTQPRPALPPRTAHVAASRSDRAKPRQGQLAPRARRDPATDHRVRFTLDLERPQHRFLKQFALDADSDASVVLRVLLSLLEEDRTLAKRVRGRIVELLAR